MKNFKTVILFFALFILAFDQIHADEPEEFKTQIISVKERRATIATANSYTSKTGVRSRKDAVFTAFQSPFGADSVDPAKALKVDQVAKEKAQHSPQGILQKIADRLQPSGTITKNGKYILLFGPHLVPEGEKINATFDGQSYQVEIQNINENTFQVRMGDFTIEKAIESHVDLSKKIKSI